MENLSKGKKERLAVNAIKNEAELPGSHLIPDIPDGDKAPSFDGKITVFENGSEHKESYMNDIPTQVKGTEVQSFSTRPRTFSLEMTHFKNYYKRGGCLLLVVEILDNGKTKIFYRSLLPVELNEIISTKGKQKTYSVELRPLSETNLYAVCLKMVEQMKKQTLVLIEQKQFEDNEYEQFILQSVTYNYRDGNFRDIFNHDFFQYGIKDGIHFPLRTGRISSISAIDQKKIRVKDRTYEVKMKMEVKLNQTLLLIEDCLQIILTEDEGITFKMIHLNSVHSQMKAFPILIDLLKNGEFSIGEFHFELPKDDGLSQKIVRFERRFEIIKKLKKVFLELGIDDRVQIGNENNINEQIALLICLILEKDYSQLRVKNPEKPCYIQLELGDIKIILFYNPNASKKLINPFTEEFLKNHATVVVNDTEERKIISPYLLLGEETLCSAINQKFDDIIKSFNLIERPNSALVFNTVNEFILSCLNAYDTTQNHDLLRLVYALIDIYRDQKPAPGVLTILKVNWLQAKYRDEGLDRNDYKILRQMKKGVDSFEVPNELEFCINVLLESKNEADLCFEQIERQAYYRTLPIFHLYKRLL